MVDTLDLPTVFFTHSAADSQWPELACLLCPENEDSSSNRSKVVSDNPAITDCFFSHRICGGRPTTGRRRRREREEGKKTVTHTNVL